MSDEKPNSPSKLSKILEGSFTNAQERESFITAQQTQLNDAGYSYFYGNIAQAGPINDGTFNVQFNTATTGYATVWPQWAYEAAREALLHGKKVMVIHTADGPFGYNLVGVLIQDTPA
jgi:hypothetical protein